MKRVNKQRQPNGLTLIEVMIAMFIFLVGIIGVLAAMPSGIGAAHQVIFQDAAIHLSRSKFAEFRRDRIDPRVDLVVGSQYLDATNSPPRRQEKQNGNPGNWRDFAHDVGDTYENFDNIEQYQWTVDQTLLKPVITDTPANNNAPLVVNTVTPAQDLTVTRVVLVIGMKGSAREQRFTQYMLSPGNGVQP